MVDFKKMLVLLIVVLGFFSLIGSGGGEDEKEDPGPGPVSIQSVTESEDNSDGRVKIKDFSVSSKSESDYSISYDVSYNNPDFIYYQMDIYLIEKSETESGDWEDGNYIGYGVKLLSKSSNSNRISGAFNFAYDSLENEIYYEGPLSGKYVSLISDLSDYFLLCVGSTQLMDLGDYSFSHFESHVIIAIE